LHLLSNTFDISGGLIDTVVVAIIARPCSTCGAPGTRTGAIAMYEDDPNRRRAALVGHARVSTFARRVLGKISKLPSHSRRDRAKAFALWLADFCCGDLYSNNRVHDELERLRLTGDDLVLQCIPTAAAILGERWCADDAGFAEVSLGSARLLMLCRAYVPDWTWAARKGNGPCFLLCTFDTEQHLIGSAVLAYRLRKAGFSVNCLVQADMTQIVEKLRSAEFDSLLISCSTTASLETAAQAVKHIREKVKRPPFIGLGGAMAHSAKALGKRIEVDLITNNLDAVVSKVSAGCLRDDSVEAAE